MVNYEASRDCTLSTGADAFPLSGNLTISPRVSGDNTHQQLASQSVAQPARRTKRTSLVAS